MRSILVLGILLVSTMPFAAADDVCVEEPGAAFVCNGLATGHGHYGAAAGGSSGWARHGADWSAACVDVEPKRSACAFLTPFGDYRYAACAWTYPRPDDCTQVSVWEAEAWVRGEEYRVVVPYDVIPECVVASEGSYVCRYWLVPRGELSLRVDSGEVCAAGPCYRVIVTPFWSFFEDGANQTFGIRDLHVCGPAYCPRELEDWGDVLASLPALP